MENLLFIMPSETQEFLAAIATIQALFFEFKEGEFQRSYYAQIYSSNPANDFLLPALLDEGKAERIDSIENLSRRDFDIVFKFDANLAYAIGSVNQKHITSAFGLMLGSDPSSLPDLSKVTFPKAIYDCCVLDNLPCHAEIASDTNDPRQARMVVGVRSVETYIACALLKEVVEVYPDDRYRRWMSKFKNRRYKMVYGGLRHVTAAQVKVEIDKLKAMRPVESPKMVTLT